MSEFFDRTTRGPVPAVTEGAYQVGYHEGVWGPYPYKAAQALEVARQTARQHELDGHSDVAATVLQLALKEYGSIVEEANSHFQA